MTILSKCKFKQLIILHIIIKLMVGAYSIGTAKKC